MEPNIRRSVLEVFVVYARNVLRIFALASLLAFVAGCPAPGWYTYSEVQTDHEILHGPMASYADLFHGGQSGPHDLFSVPDPVDPTVRWLISIDTPQPGIGVHSLEVLASRPGGARPSEQQVVWAQSRVEMVLSRILEQDAEQRSAVEKSPSRH
jgi:hypothetical protein